MAEKVRLGGDPIPELGLTQNPFAPKIIQPTRPITLEDVKDVLKTFIAVVGNYTLEHSIYKAREKAIKTLKIRDYDRLKEKERWSKLTPEEQKLLESIETRISELIDKHPEWITEEIQAQKEIGGRDAYYYKDWQETYTAIEKLCHALNIPMPKMPYLDYRDLELLAKQVCQTAGLKAPYFKPPWEASRILCWLAYNTVYHYYKALPQTTPELNEAVKEFDHAITDLKISLDWE